MKKILFVLLSLMMIIFLGCDDFVNDVKDVVNENVEDAYLGETDVPNNKSESVGTNELTGKTVSDGTTKMTFANSYVTKSDDTSSSANARSADHVSGKMDFTYSYNSYEKTLEFQLNQVWGSDLPLASTYEDQIKKATDTYKSISDSVVSTLEKFDYTVFEGVGDKVKAIVVEKAKEYVKDQEEILTVYLDDKYKDILEFGYAFDDEENPTKLILSEKFKGNLNDASSKFISEADYEGVKIILNDYDNVIPFYIEVTDDDGNVSEYVGVPKFDDPEELEGSLTVSLIPYHGDILSPKTLTSVTIASEISTLITEKLSSALLDDNATTIGSKIITELSTSNESATLSSLIDEAIAGQMLKFSFEVTPATDTTAATVKFTLTEVPPECVSILDDPIELTHTPLLGATYNIVK